MTDQTDDFFVASVPDLPSPNIIQYYVEVSDSLGNTAREPAGAPQEVRSFAIGRYVPAFVANFDNILSDEGWSHGSYGDTSNQADDWERSTPGGAGGTELGGGINGIYWSDPSQAVSGDFVWGDDLGLTGDGQYPNNAHMWLRSPQIDASSWLGCRLQFQRQLSVARLDEARLRVEGTTLYESGDLDDTSDLDWTPVEYDISSFADGNSALDLEWELESDGGVRLGGWNIDSVRVMRLVAASAGDCLEPRAYGPGKIHSGSTVAEIFHQGQPQVDEEFSVQIRFAVPSQPSLLFSGQNSVEMPFLGGHRLVGGDIQRHGARVLSLAGAAGFELDVIPSQAGATRFYQVWFRDPANSDGTGVGLSPGLRVDYCL
jgi:catechol 2,3-dioxygenase-like lactoylglutathione lyase family enzyme